jgi:hypothetical protein
MPQACQQGCKICILYVFPLWHTPVDVPLLAQAIEAGSEHTKCDAFARSERSPCFRFKPLGLSRCTTKSCVAICSLLCLLLYSICPSSFLMSPPCSRTFHDWHSLRTPSHLELYLHSPAACHSQRRLRTTTICQCVAMLTPPHAPITSMPPSLSHVFMFIVLVSFLDISCAHDSFSNPWRLTHRWPLTHVA